MSTQATILAIEPGTFQGMSGRPITFSANVIKRCAESFLGKPVKRHHKGEMKFAAGRGIGIINSSDVNDDGQNYQQIEVSEPVKLGDGTSVEVLTMTDREGNVLAFVGEGVAMVDKAACRTCKVTKVGLSEMTTDLEKELGEQLAVERAKSSNLQTQHAEALAAYKSKEDEYLAAIAGHEQMVKDQNSAIKKLGEGLAAFRANEVNVIIDQIKLSDAEFDADKWMTENFGAPLEDIEVKKKVFSAYLKGIQKDAKVQLASGAPLGAGTSGSPFGEIFKAADMTKEESLIAQQFLAKGMYK